MIYLANDKYNDALTSGYTVGQNVLYVSTPPDNVPTIIVAAKGTDDETVFSVTGKTINSLTGVTRIRGANVDLDTQTPITCLNNQEFVNQYATAVFSIDTLSPLQFGVDGGSSDAYAVTLDPAPTEYAEGMMVIFTANTTNTGASSLNVNSLGAKTIKKFFDQDLEDGDIQAGQIVTVVYDGTNFQLVSSIEGGISADETVTLTNKRITKRVGTTTSSATPTINTDDVDMYVITAQTTDITSFTTNLSGTPTNGQTLWIAITGTAARAITWGSSFESSTVTLPTTTTSTNRLDVGLVWNTATSKWRCVAVA